MEEAPPTTGTRLEPLRSMAIDVVAQLPRLLLGALSDVRSIAESVRVLPELAQQLGAIQSRVESLDEEVTKMRRSVDAIGDEVVGVRESVRPLQRLNRQGRVGLFRRGEPSEPG